MSTISISRGAVVDCPQGRSFSRTEHAPEVRVASEAKLWKHSLKRSATAERTEEFFMAILTIGGMVALAHGLALVGALSTHWSQIESKLNGLLW